MKKMDRYLFGRLFIITFFVLLVLICIFILIDFSENSDDFTDRGATLAQIWNDYYLNYIPEMIRLLSPMAIFVACLFLAGQMSERLEIIALKAAGVSLYRLSIPFIVFGITAAITLSYLDAFTIPKANAERINFEREFISKKSDRIDQGGLFRQDSDSTILNINYFDPSNHIAYRVTYLEFNENKISKIVTTNRLKWDDSLSVWFADRYKERVFENLRYSEKEDNTVEMDLNILPGDLTRRSSDVYQLTYPEAFRYIKSIERIGAGGISLPTVQLYSRIAYPLSIVVVCLIGFAIASERWKGGKGVYIAAGLTISFIYLAAMKILEPFGAADTISPAAAAFIPHGLFFVLGIILLIAARK